MKNINKEELLISIDEAARLTGMAVTTWRHWIAGRTSGGEAPPVRIVRLGVKAVRVHKGDLLKWIEDCSSIPKAKRRRGRPKKSDQIAKERRSQKVG